MVFRCSSGWVLRISEWRGPESLGLGGAHSCICVVPVHTGVSCSDCWLNTCCVAPEAWRLWLVPASQGPPETLRPEDCTGPLFRGLRPPQSPAGPGTQHSVSAGGLDRGWAAPGQRQAHTQPCPWAPVSCPDAHLGRGNKERARPAVGATAGRPLTPRPPAG